jgi:hypothetical protein
MLIRQTALDFMIWDQWMRDKFHAWYVKNPQSIFSDPIMDSLVICACTQMTIIFSPCLLLLLFFFCLWWSYTSLRSKNESLSRRKHIMFMLSYRVLNWFPPQFSVSANTTHPLLYCTLPLSIYCSECHSASRLKKSQVSQPDRVFVLLIA